MCTNLQMVLNRLVCRCANVLVMANEIAGFGGLNSFYLTWVT
jgi:hypothetical protein